MRRDPRSFSETLTRSLALSGLAYAVVIAYAVPATLLSAESRQPASVGERGSSLSRATQGSQLASGLLQEVPRLRGHRAVGRP